MTMTKQQQQEIFDRVSTHLLKQNSKSTKVWGAYNKCAYRGNDGMMCAIGCLITDENYSYDMENKHVKTAIVSVRLMKSLGINFIGEDYKFLEDLQLIHDASEPQYWYEDFKEFAAKYALTMPTLPEYSK